MGFRPSDAPSGVQDRKPTAVLGSDQYPKFRMYDGVK
jgi:hypothetical protein